MATLDTPEIQKVLGDSRKVDPEVAGLLLRELYPKDTIDKLLDEYKPIKSLRSFKPRCWLQVLLFLASRAS